MTRRVALALLVLWFMQAMLWPASPASSPTTAVAIGTQDAETGGMQYANWYFGQDNLTSVSVAIQINRDPLTDDGLYFQSYNGYINGHQFYFGLQTRVGKPGYALTGKGLILSEFGTVDSSNMRVAPGGWYEVGSGEGLFISTRFGYAWKAGNYVLAIKYQETDATGDWYAFWITDTSANVQTYAGALRFATPSSQSKKGIGDGGGSWTELYYREVQDSVLPEWSISIVEVSAVSRDGNTLHPNTAYLRNADNFYHIDQVFHSDSNHLDFLIGGSSTKSFTAKSVTLTPYPAPSIPDTTPPTITVAPGIDGSVVSAATLRLTGKATDNVGVGQVYVGFNKVDMGADGSFASTVTLADGLNTITVTAYDSAGNKSTLTIKVTFNRPDITPPVLSITSPANGTTTTSSQVTLRGTVTDAGSGLDYLEVNGTRVAVSSGSFTTTITLTPGSNTVTVSAWDKAGNKTEKTLTLTYQQGTVLVLTIGSTIATKNGGTVYLDTAPVITNGRTLVPLRFIAEAFGIDPIWNSSLKTIKLALSGGRLLTMQIGKGTCFVEWVGTTRTDAISLDAPPVIMNGRTLVPIRFISEQLGAVVVWDSITRRVTITWKG